MKKSVLKGKTLSEIRVFAKNNAIEVSNNLSKAKTLEVIFNSNYQFVPEEPTSDKFFKIGNRKITALSNITTIGAIKAQVGYMLKFNPTLKRSDLSITTPNGKVFKVSELNNPQSFIKMQFASVFTDFSQNKETEKAKELISEIVKNAYRMPLDWEKVGTSDATEITELFLKTAKAMQKVGQITEESLKLIESYE